LTHRQGWVLWIEGARTPKDTARSTSGRDGVRLVLVVSVMT
jgi:hypothetical protein